MRLMFLRVISWLSDTWRYAYLTRRRYHSDTNKAKTSPRRQRLTRLFAQANWSAALRGVLFWALMAIAAIIIYTEQVPLFTPSLGKHPSQGGLVPGEDASAVHVQPDMSIKQFNALPDVPFSTSDAAVHNTGADEPVTVESVPTEQEQPTQPSARSNQEDEVAAVLAGLPQFEIADMLQPLQGKVVRPLGWYRHEVYGDWRMATGLTIAPAQPGEPVLAAYTGVVDQVTKLEGNTWSVKVLHQDGWATEYGGLERVTVEPGSVVKQGEQLGVTADAVESTVSFTLRHRDDPVDTIAYWR